LCGSVLKPKSDDTTNRNPLTVNALQTSDAPIILTLGKGEVEGSIPSGGFLLSLTQMPCFHGFAAKGKAHRQSRLGDALVQQLCTWCVIQEPDQ
jgi:hypothetical protein